MATLFTTGEIAYMLGRTPASVRVLVARGVLTPVDRVPSEHGKPTMRFDARLVAEMVAAAPWLDKRPAA